MKKSLLYTKILVNIIISIVFLALAIFLLPRLVGFFLPFVIGWIIAMIANPLVKFLEKRLKIVRKWSSVVIIIVVLVGVTVVLYFLGSALFTQAKNFVGDLQKNYGGVDTSLRNFTSDLQEKYTFIPDKVIDSINEFTTQLDDTVSNWIKGIAMPDISDASNLVKGVADGMFFFIITVISSYFFIAEKDHIMEKFKESLPVSVEEYWTMITNNFTHAVGGYFKAQLKIMVVITAILFVGFLILRVNYAILLAFGIAFLDFLPVFGTGAVIWPWTILSLINGEYRMVIGLLILYLTCQIVKQVLQPKMVGDSIGLSPLWTLIFLYIGYKIGGLLGIILGIPIGMIIVSLYKSGAFDRITRGIKIIINDLNEFRKY